MAGGSSLRFRIIGDSSSAERAMARVRQEADKSSRGIRDSFKALAGAAAGFGVVQFVKDSVAGWEDHQRVMRQAQAVIKSTGAAAGLNAKQFEALSDTIEKQTGLDGDLVLNAENVLATFTNIRDAAGKNNDIFTQSTKVIGDMSAALGQDMKASAIQVGKALNDPIKGVTALQKVGVSFTQQQRDQITALVQSGRTMDAQRVILRELNKEFGGSAAAQETSSQKMGVAVRELQDAIGQGLAPVFHDVADVLTHDVVPAVTTTVHFLEDHATEAKVVAGAVLGLWGAYKGYTILKAVSAWTSTAGIRYRQYVAELSYGNGIQRATSSGLQSLGMGFRTSATAAQVGAARTVAAQREVAAASTTTTRAVVANNAAMSRSLGLGAAALGGLGAVALTLPAAVGGELSIIKELVGQYKMTTGSADTSAKAIISWAAKTKDAILPVQYAIKGLHITSDQLTAGVSGTDAQYQAFIATLKKHGSVSDENRAILDKLHGAFANTATAASAAAGATDKHTGAQKHTKTVMDLVSEAARRQSQQLRTLVEDELKLSGDSLSITQAQLQFRDSLAAASDQVKENGRSLQANTAKGRANREWLLQQIQAMNDVASAQENAGRSAPTIARTMLQNERALRRAANAAGFNKQQIDELIKRYATKPPVLRFIVNADATNAYGTLDRFVRRVNSMHGTILIGARPASGTGAYASGTNSAPPGWAWVGERGPELLKFRGGERVLSAPASAQVAKGYANGTITAAQLGGGGPVRIVLDAGSIGVLTGYIDDRAGAVVHAQAGHDATLARMHHR